MTLEDKFKIAKLFGEYLDTDQYTSFKALLTLDCLYLIYDTSYHNADDIAQLYASNMKAGKEKLDRLEWGKAIINHLKDDVFNIHFTDYLEHKGLKHTYECNQWVYVNDQLKIYKIVHKEIPEKKKALAEFYEKVGLS